MTESDQREADRARGILTPADRRFLRGDTEYANDQSERDARYRIRERLFNGILDFEVALRGLESRDISMVMDRLDDEDVDGIVAVAEYLEAAREAEQKRDQMLTTLERDRSPATEAEDHE